MHTNTAQKNAACTVLAGFNNFAQVREYTYTAVCSYIPTAGKYRGKPLALCKTLVARTCSLEAAHSARCSFELLLDRAQMQSTLHCGYVYAVLTSTLYYMLHYTARAPYCVATHALPPVSEVSQFRLSVFFFSWP